MQKVSAQMDRDFSGNLQATDICVHAHPTVRGNMYQRFPKGGICVTLGMLECPKPITKLLLVEDALGPTMQLMMAGQNEHISSPGVLN